MVVVAVLQDSCCVFFSFFFSFIIIILINLFIFYFPGFLICDARVSIVLCEDAQWLHVD